MISLSFRQFNGRKKHDSKMDQASFDDVACETEYYYKQVTQTFSQNVILESNSSRDVRRYG